MKIIMGLLLLSSASSIAQAPKCPPAVGHIDLTSGTYSSQPGVTFRLRHFSAALVPQATTAPLCFQKYTVVSHAEIFVSNQSLTKVFSTKLTDSASKIKDFKVVNFGDGVKLSGTITKLIPIHFSVYGPVTTDGVALILHADKVKADGVPIKALLELVGQHLSSVLNMKNIAGITVQENTMSFFPEQIAHLKGTIHSVMTSPDGILLTYTPAASAPTHKAAPLAGDLGQKSSPPLSPAPSVNRDLHRAQ